MATVKTYEIEGQIVNIYAKFDTNNYDITVGMSLNDKTSFTLNNKKSFTLEDIDEDAVKYQLESLIECFNREILCFTQDIVSTDNYIENDRTNITES